MTPFVIEATDMWQPTNLDHYVAEELFGWQWLAFIGIPVRSAPGYPAKCRVRQFFPPGIKARPGWQEYLEKNEASEATGEEPLSYRYCSSQPTHMVPHFSGHEDVCKRMESEIRGRRLWSKYREILAAQCGADDEEALHFADCKSRCIAALAAVGSRYVVTLKGDDA